MKITKYGHSCLYIEEGGATAGAGRARILIDPGSYCFQDMPLRPEDLPAADVILLTHPHPDHTDPDALAIMLKKNPAPIWTNTSVQKVLQDAGIVSEVLQRGETRTIKGVAVYGVACDHGLIADFFPKVENIGFLIAGKLFHPGDCVAPLEEVHADILAAPIAAPWMAVREGVAFVKAFKPKVVIPIHDGIVKYPETPWYKIFEAGLKDTGIAFTPLKIGEPKDF